MLPGPRLVFSQSTELHWNSEFDLMYHVYLLASKLFCELFVYLYVYPCCRAFMYSYGTPILVLVPCELESLEECPGRARPYTIPALAFVLNAP